MHVLIIPSWYPNHPRDIKGCFFREQAIALGKYGCKVGVIYPELRSPRNWRSNFSTQYGITVEQDEGVATYRYKGINWFPRTVIPAMKLFVWHGMQLYNRYIAENGVPDVVHAHSLLNAGSVADKIHEKKNIPFVVTEHSSAFARRLVSEAEIIVAKNSSGRATRRLAVSMAFAELLDNLIGSENIHWEEVPNIVNEEFLSSQLNFGSANKDFEFINVALMGENKQQSNILHAFAKVSKKREDIRLTLGGDGPMRKQLEQLSHDLNISGKVKFTGMLSREQVLATIAGADTFVLSSRYETFSVVLIEALALGKSVIATRCGGPESIVRKEDGILTAVDDIDALAEAMLQMVENRNYYQPEKIREACRARYSEAAIAKRLMNIYAEVAAPVVRC